MLLLPVFRSLESRVMVNIDAVYFFVSEISRNVESSSVWMDFFLFHLQALENTFRGEPLFFNKFEGQRKIFWSQLWELSFYWRNGKKREVSDCAMQPRSLILESVPYLCHVRSRTQGPCRTQFESFFRLLLTWGTIGVAQLLETFLMIDGFIISKYRLPRPIVSLWLSRIAYFLLFCLCVKY